MALAEGRVLPGDSLVSMNFWCFPESFMDVLSVGFLQFLSAMSNPQKDEYLLPIIVDSLLQGGTEVSVLPTEDRWFGVTYKEDKTSVVESFKRIYQDGIYCSDNLYADLYPESSRTINLENRSTHL